MSRNTTLVVSALIFFLGGCAQMQSKTVGPLESGQYSTEISRLEAVVSQNPDSSSAQQAHYQLAQRYMSYKNPQRDYAKALRNLELYSRNNPDAARNQELQDWLAALQEIQQLSRDKRVARINAKLEESRQANLELKELNAELNKKIDMLKILDQAVEEKRKTHTTE
ncbi:MAG: outer membrane protein assembly factor BamD [Halieaceae bacterium]